jgi:hypothetical protein
VVVLCEHHVFVVAAASGVALLQRRLDYHPAAGCMFPCALPRAANAPNSSSSTGGDGVSNGEPGLMALLVATHNRTAHVYRQHALVWAAALPLQPVSVAVTALRCGGSSHGGGCVVL